MKTNIPPTEPRLTWANQGQAEYTEYVMLETRMLPPKRKIPWKRELSNFQCSALVYYPRINPGGYYPYTYLNYRPI